MSSHARLDSLTGLRFFAAMFVVLHHVWFLLASLGIADRLLQFGYVGVGFFFALSGFVLTWSAREGDRARAFYRRRFARIYPLHLACLVPGVVLLATGSLQPAWWTIPLTVLLLQAWEPTTTAIEDNLNGPSWSLSDEAFFYALFPVLAGALVSVSRQSLLRVALAVGVAIVVGLTAGYGLLPSDVADEVFDKLPLFRIGSFVAGMLVALAVKQGVRFPGVRATSAAAAFALIAIAIPHIDWASRPVIETMLLPLWLLLIGSAATADLHREPSVFRRRALVHLGVRSYALYLVHWPLLLIVLEIWPDGFSARLPLAAAETLLFALGTVAAAYAAYRLIERPLERRLRGAPPSAIERQA